MHRFALTIIVALVAGCATPYQAMGLRGGYTDERLGNKRFLVTFEGNGFTSATTVARYLVRRATELCHSIGYGSFVPITQDGGSDVSMADGVLIQKHSRSLLIECTEPLPPPDG